MRSQLVMMKRSAQGEHQKMDFKEKIKTIDHYTKQLKNSGYGWVQAREIVSCGLKGLINKCNRRQQAGEEFYTKSWTDTGYKSQEMHGQKFMV